MIDYAVTRIIKVVDGDTVDLEVDPGFHLRYAGRFRLVLVDTPERGEPGWSEATAFTRGWTLATFNGGRLRAATYKADSFGRFLVDLYDKETGETLASALLKIELAEVWS